jgi:copper chaperone CopZ
MKKLFMIAVITLTAMVSRAQFTQATLQATGLTCAMCSNAINKALQKVPFIQSVRSDIKNSSFNIVFKSNEAVHIDELREAVEDAGFSIGSLKLTGTFNAIKIEKDQHIKIGGENFHFLGSDSRVLNGEQTVTIVDKNYVTEKQFKKHSSTTKMSCMQSGKASSCCIKEGISEGERVYHVTI